MKYINIILLFALISSCVEPLDLDLNSGDNLKLVIDAWLDDTDRAQTITLSLTSDYYEGRDQLRFATGATVAVSVNGVDYSFIEGDSGRYQLNGQIDSDVGDIYYLTVLYEGISYTASQELRRVPTAEKYTYLQLEDLRKVDDFLYFFSVTVQEPIGLGDHYAFNSFRKGDLPKLKLGDMSVASDEFVDGSYIDDVGVSNGNYNPKDTIVNQLRSISEEAFEYVERVSEQTENRGEVFDLPPANVPTNISGGAKGFFIVSSITELEIVID